MHSLGNKLQTGVHMQILIHQHLQSTCTPYMQPYWTISNSSSFKWAKNLIFLSPASMENWTLYGKVADTGFPLYVTTTSFTSPSKPPISNSGFLGTWNTTNGPFTRTLVPASTFLLSSASVDLVSPTTVFSETAQAPLLLVWTASAALPKLNSLAIAPNPTWNASFLAWRPPNRALEERREKELRETAAQNQPRQQQESYVNSSTATQNSFAWKPSWKHSL